MSNSEEKSVIIKILLLYLVTTGIFLSVLFGLYYDRGYGLIVHNKANELREEYVGLTRVIDKNTKFDKKTLEAIKALDLNTEFVIYDKFGNVLYNHLALELPQKSFSKNGVFVQNGYVLIDFNPARKHKHYKRVSAPPSFEYRIIMKGASILPDIWQLRLKTTGFLLLTLIGVGVVAYFLFKLSLRPLKDKIAFLDHFIKDTTHEINTPVSVILMSIERLHQKNISEDDCKKINRIAIAAKTIANIYQNLVLYSFSQNAIQKTFVDMREVLEQRLEFFTPLFAQKNLQIKTSINPAKIEANKDGMQCIIDNLLSNAIKYNHKGGEIQIHLEASSLRIIDSGCGIEKKQMHKIFERYTRYDTSQGGFGIGLALVGELCERYGIEIDCQSVVGKGSEFLLQWQNVT